MLLITKSETRDLGQYKITKGQVSALLHSLTDSDNFSPDRIDIYRNNRHRISHASGDVETS